MSFALVDNSFARVYQGPKVDLPAVCWPLKVGGSKWRDNELRYSFRAFARYWHPTLSRPKVFLLTSTPPPWINRDMVKVVREAEGYVGAIKAALSLAETRSPSKHYMWWNDDIFLLKDSVTDDFLTSRNVLGPMSPMSGLRGNGWRKKLCRVRDTVHKLGFGPVYNFSSHTPYLFHAPTMQKVIACVGVQYKTPIETAYYNMTRAWHPRQKCRDKLVFYKDKPFPDDLSPYRFMSVSDRGLSARVRAFLQGRFSEKCVYES